MRLDRVFRIVWTTVRLATVRNINQHRRWNPTFEAFGKTIGYIPLDSSKRNSIHNVSRKHWNRLVG